MSATINHEVFVKYFHNAPLLTIPGFTHPVDDLYVLTASLERGRLTKWYRYLEDYLPRLSYRQSGSKHTRKGKGDDDEVTDAGLDEDCRTAIRTIMRTDSFDYDVRSLRRASYIQSSDTHHLR